ncbi:MAG: TIGR00375 family protein [Candidatus Micrarchaeia archaeon]
MIVNADLHLHGKYSGAVSNDMLPAKIGEQAKLKGLHLVGTADILNMKWIDEIKRSLSEENGTFIHSSGTRFILQTEIEDANRVHHILLFPSMSKVMEVRERLSKYTKDLDTEGRPKVHLNGEEIAEIAIEAEALIGPSHAFTPWTSLYKEYDSFKDCYGKYSDKIYFLELGLSADTDMADRIEEIKDITFLSNSDAHSPWPNKMGREFTSFEMQEISFEELKLAIMRKKGRRPVLNVKFDPREGKYHRTRCMNCLVFYSLKDAESFKWRCPVCRKPIKKGVAERIEELANGREIIHPEHRPKCIHIIPLSEIIAIAHNVKSPYSQKVQEIWRKYIESFGTEIDILIKAEINDLERIDKKVSELISSFRDNRFKYIPGGAGQYGIPVPPGKKASYKVWKGNKVVEVDVNDEETFSSQPSITDFM